MAESNGAVAAAEAEETQPVEQIPDQTAGDAGETQADAASSDESTQEADAALAAEAQAWADSQEDKGSDEDSAPESTRRRGPDPQAVAEALQKFRNNYGTRQQRIDALQERLNKAGLSETEAEYFVKQAKDILNEHHADSLENAGLESAELKSQEIDLEFEEGLKTALTKDEMNAFTEWRRSRVQSGEGFTFADSFEKLRDLTYQTGVKAGLKKGREEGFVAGRKAGEASRESANSGNEVGGTATGNIPTLAQWNAMKLEQRHEWRQKDPQIEAKIQEAGR